MIRTAIALLGVSAILGYLGWRQAELRTRAAEEPSSVTVRELLTRDVAANAHIVLSGFDFCESFGYAEKRVGSGWSIAFFPIVPAGERSSAGLRKETVRVEVPNAEAPQRGGVGLSGGEGRVHGGASLPAKITAIIVSRRVHNASDVGRLVEQRTVQGLVISAEDALNRYERSELQARFPSINLTRVLLIEEGRQPPGAWLMTALVAGSGFALAGAAALGGVALRKRRKTHQGGTRAAPAAELDRWVKRVDRNPPKRD
jgi:hypothetical protein